MPDVLYMQFLRNFSGGTKTGTYHIRVLEKRERFQNGQEAPEGIGHPEKETY